MKTFAGQPNWATQEEVKRLEWKVNRLEKEMNSEYQNGGNHNACDRCPQSMDVCLALSTLEEQTHCRNMHDQCQKYCK